MGRFSVVEFLHEMEYYGNNIQREERGEKMKIDLCVDFDKVNWDAVSSIGTWVGGIATVFALILALHPFLRKGRVYFSAYSNIEKKMVLHVVNSKDQGMIIEKIEFFTGPIVLRKLFLVDKFLEEQDDLISDKSAEDNYYIEPFGKKKIIYDSSRIIHGIQHFGKKIGCFSHLNMRIVVCTNLGKIKVRTKCQTKNFLEHMIVNSESYRNISVNQLIN